jgi:hypothetical protein
MELKIKKVTILTMKCHPDLICFEVENNLTPLFPDLQKQDPNTFTTQCARGYAETWCKLNNIIVDEIVNI